MNFYIPGHRTSNKVRNQIKILEDVRVKIRLFRDQRTPETLLTKNILNRIGPWRCLGPRAGPDLFVDREWIQSMNQEYGKMILFCQTETDSPILCQTVLINTLLEFKGERYREILKRGKPVNFSNVRVLHYWVSRVRLWPGLRGRLEQFRSGTRPERPWDDAS